MTTACSHAFHRRCLATLREKEASNGPSACPLCRSQLEPGYTPSNAHLKSRVGAARSAVAYAQHMRHQRHQQNGITTAAQFVDPFVSAGDMRTSDGFD